MLLSDKIKNLKSLLISLATSQEVLWESNKIQKRLWERSVRHNVIFLREPGVTDEQILPDGRQVIVSLSTFGPRLQETATSIECIMEQTQPANRIVLWLGREMEAEKEFMPASIRRLMKRGLEIRYTDDIGPATKLIPALKAFPEDVIITIDDDMLYETDIIDRLVVAHKRWPNAVCAARIDRISAVGKDSLELIYNDAAELYLTSEPLMRPMGLGCGGVLYPPHSLHSDVMDVELMLKLAPTSDDLWFKVQALRNGTPLMPVSDSDPTHDTLVDCRRYRRSLALWTMNMYGGRDQKHLQALCRQYPEIMKYYI